jgi:hypothetical protein
MLRVCARALVSPTLALSGRHAARRLPCKRSDARMSAAAACYEANLRASDTDNKACWVSA